LNIDEIAKSRFHSRLASIFNGYPSKLFELLDKQTNLFGKRCAFGGGNPLEPKTALINSQQP